jgi:hypothetical protein
MTSNFLNVTAIVALAGACFLAPGLQSPSTVASRPTAPERAVASPPVVASNDLQAHRPPVPLVQRVRPPVAAIAPDLPLSKAEIPSQEDVDWAAAKAAIEADGYKSVRVLAKGSSGTWQAKVYRGATEIEVSVDSSGRVSAQ